MFFAIVLRYSHWILLAQLALVAAAFFSRGAGWWLTANCSAAVVSLLAWIASVRETEIIRDTPTSIIASAAQGYVELNGRPSGNAEYVQIAKSGLPCVWFRCVSYRKSGGQWREIDRVVSDAIFEINDGSGDRCLVDPEHATVITSNRRTWFHNDYMHIEEQLFPGQPLYILGDFTTLGADTAEADLELDVSRLLADWKKDRANLLARFDANHDGKIDMNEWQEARKAAFREVGRQSRNLSEQPGVHILGKPKSGKLFLISNLSESALRGKSRFWAWLHIIMFFVFTSGAFWLALKHLFFS